MADMYLKADEHKPAESREALCEQLQGFIRASKKHFKTDFDRMIEDMQVAMDGASKDWPRGNYIVNITQRFVRQKVASLYAKNPRAVAKRKQRMEYMIWDGDTQSLMAAQQQIQMAMESGMPPPQEAMALLQDVQEGSARSRMIARVGKSLELLYRYYTDEQIPSFKAQMKKCVRATVQTAVGYVRIGFQRATDLSPDNKAKIADMAQRIAHIERLQNDLQDQNSGIDPEASAEAEELKLAMAALQQEKTVILREGLVFDWPSSTAIIPDQRCTSLKGWIGAAWIAEEIYLTPDEVKEFYNIDLGNKGPAAYKAYSVDGADYNRNPRNDLPDKARDLVCVWIMYHKPSGLKYSMADGYCDFLEEPIAPEVTLERFFPVYALCFNELVHNKRLFPNSDVRYIMSQQMELNRSRQAVREHRIANRPGYAVPRGSMSDDDKVSLGKHPANAVIEIDGLVPGQKIADVLQGLPKIGVDPNLYDTSGVMNDVLLAVGASESTFGSTSGATATEASIAESNRTGAVEAEVDELNDFLTEIARDAGQVLLMELDVQTVKEIVGPGAIWPEMSKADIAKELFLDVVAGSNGRPNRAQRQQALQMLAPILLQIPGINPEWFAKLMIESVDDSIDLTEAIAANVPSIMQMNNATQPAPAEGEDPNAQGPQGGNNAQQPQRPAQGAGPQRPRPVAQQANVSAA